MGLGVAVVEEVCALPLVDTVAGNEAAGVDAGNEATGVEAAPLGTKLQLWKPHLWTLPHL
jgi:hypothetical protein